MVGSKYLQTAVLFKCTWFDRSLFSVKKHLEQTYIHAKMLLPVSVYKYFQIPATLLGMLTFKCTQCLQYLVLPTKVSSPMFTIWLCHVNMS